MSPRVGGFKTNGGYLCSSSLFTQRILNCLNGNLSVGEMAGAFMAQMAGKVMAQIGKAVLAK